ncbi:ribonuclease hi [Plakobranchus ocellatus]|uniref:Ribonuclease hi n=1 Tax=Plakobranchus ocellatus TaxID=259542 RepID=A0AAV4C0S0_9GAST|nr:ribonuclease hi [Plakobranchus ocellatus]
MCLSSTRILKAMKSCLKHLCYKLVLEQLAMHKISIRGNENVDKLAKAALNRASYSGKLNCWSDLKPQIDAYIYSAWQKNWDAEGANRLHEVHPNLGEDLHRRGKGACRKRETAMCRLRVGHTWLTQSYLLKNKEQPFYYACDSLYTVWHILIECPDFQDTRRKYFSVTDLYRLFREVNPSRIVGYLSSDDGFPRIRGNPRFWIGGGISSVSAISVASAASAE